MTSFFGKANLSSSDDFKKDIRFVRSISLKDMEWVIEKLHKWLLDDSVNDSNELVEDISSQLKLKYREAQRLLSITKFLFEELGPNGDASDDDTRELARDLVTAEVVDSESDEFYAKLFDLIRNNIGAEYLNKINEDKFKSEGIPRIVGITSTVNLRAIIDKKYDSDENIEEYEPNISGFVPLATLRLRASDDSPTENFYCQVEQKALRKIINHLTAVEKELSLIEKLKGEVGG